MKRSEMIIVLQEAIITHMNCSSACCPDEETMCSRILRELEQAGMEPPAYPDPDYAAYYGPNFSMISKWEEED